MQGLRLWNVAIFLKITTLHISFQFIYIAFAFNILL
jgi:hypothetical protein